MTISGEVINTHPGTTMTWRQGESYIYHTADKAIGDISNPFLTIRNVKPDDAGNFTLCVRNSYGEDCGNTVLKVICKCFA